MEIERFDDAAAFGQITRSFLVDNEAPNNLILGICGTAARHPDYFDSFVGWILRSNRELLAVAAQTPPNNLILANPAPEDAVRQLARETDDLPGVIGTRPEADIFAEEWGNATRTMRQGIYRLDAVQVPIKSGYRRALPEDRTFLVNWICDFQDEATSAVPDPAQIERAIDRRLGSDGQLAGMWILEVDGVPVSISGYANPTPNGVRIGPVYTPPRFRGHGYATDLVAAQSQWLLDTGYRFVFLYTDLDNPTSNAIYERIGYEMVCESAEYSFSR